MKLKDWVEKIIDNVRLNKYPKDIIAENLKAFVQDTDCVKIVITENNQIYVMVKE